MQTITEYAGEVAADGSGRWHAAAYRAAGLIEHRHPIVDLTRRIPLVQILLQTTTLIVYGLSARDGQDPAALSPRAVSAWAAERRLPIVPYADGPPGDEQWANADREWRLHRDQAVERIRRDVAELLRNAGHDVPDAGVRSLDRYSDDPVVMTWLDLADTDPPDVPGRYSILEHYPVPRIALGVTALNDLHTG